MATAMKNNQYEHIETIPSRIDGRWEQSKKDDEKMLLLRANCETNLLLLSAYFLRDMDSMKELLNCESLLGNIFEG
jgi:hypothetical protein